MTSSISRHPSKGEVVPPSEEHKCEAFCSINDRVEKIKFDNEQINVLVEEYKPFIASCTQKVTGRYMRYGEDDELSIALMAFVESIKSYSSEKGNFLTFAQNVVRRRVIDYYRKEKRHANVIPISEYFSEDSDEEKDLSIEKSIDKFTMEEISTYRRLEIEELKQELKRWKISFFDIAEASPKWEKKRRECNKIINFIISQPEIIKTIREKKYLPIADIAKTLNIPRKNIERARNYIMAVVIIRTGDYQYIVDYVNWDDK